MLCPKCLSENADTSKFCNNCGSSFGPEAQPGFTATKTLETPIQAITKGTLIAGKYRIIEEIGRGGMGIVYKAEDTKLKRIVALKFLPHKWTSDAQARERFIHEAQAASALDHPNICTIYEIEETEDGRMYIAMAFYEGESLREKIKREPLKAEEAVDIAIQVGQGMAKAHQKGIVHRDIKPANILMTKDGAAKIVDFGLAKLAGQVKLTREGTTIGTVAYMSPEQARGDAVDQRTDIWSLGVVLYEMLAGKLPFKGDFEQTLIHSILKAEPEPITKFRKDLPPGLENIIAKALTKNPAARYQTMDELIEDLKAVAEGLKPLRAKSDLLRGRILGFKKVYVAAGLGIFIVLAALALLYLFPKRGKVYDSLAVLPFENRSQDASQQALAEDLTERLIFKFHTIASLRVPMLSTVAAYRITKKSYREIGQEQNVTAVLHTTLRRAEDNLQIRVTLLDASNEYALLTKEYNYNMRDIGTLESDVALDIVSQLRALVTPNERERLAPSQKVDPRAYDIYLEARKIYQTFTMDPSFERWKLALKYLQQAIDIDPGYAQFYWLLVTFWVYGNGFSLTSFQDSIMNAELALKKGLSLAPESFEAQLATGQINYLKWDWKEASKEFSHIVELNPGDPIAHFNYADILGALGQYDEAIVELKKAIKIDPGWDLSRTGLGNIYRSAGRYDESIATLRENLLKNPDNAYARNMLALSLALKGMKTEAVLEAEKSIASNSVEDKGLFHLNVALVYACVGRHEDARNLLDDCLTSRIGKPIDSFTVAEIFSALRDNTKAFEWLERTYQGHLFGIAQLKTDPFLDNLRSDPRFKDYLKKAGFEK